MLLCDFKKKEKDKDGAGHAAGAVGTGILVGDVVGDASVIGKAVGAKTASGKFWKDVAKTKGVKEKGKKLASGVMSDVKTKSVPALKTYAHKLVAPAIGAGVAYGGVKLMKALKGKKKKRKKS